MYSIGTPGGGHECCPTTCAGPKVTDRKLRGWLVVVEAVRGVGQAMGQQVDVEAQMGGMHVYLLFVCGEQIYQEGGKPCLLENLSYIAVAAAVTAAAAAVGKEHDACRAAGYDEIALKSDRAC